MDTPTEGLRVKGSKGLREDSIDLTQYGSCSLLDGSCQTCGEGAVPVVVVSLDGEVALVRDREGTQDEVALDFVPGVQIGDVLLVQAGLALSRIQQSESLGV